MSAPRGLFDGFETFRSPTEADYRDTMTTGIVVPDTNVLLDLYRYTEQARSALLSLFGLLGDQLWVPNQVLVEFWRNRHKTLRAPADAADNANEQLEEHHNKAVAVLRAWASRFALPDEDFDELRELLASGFTAAAERVNGLVEAHAGRTEAYTDADPVVTALEKVLEGRAGTPLSDPDHKAAVIEGLRRVAEKIPPGYKDSGKQGNDRAGDYLVWEQLVQEATRRACNVLLVTGDSKADDWWRKENGMPRAPRQELIDELSDRSGSRLFMLSPKDFTRLGSQILDLAVQDDLIEDIARVDRLRGEPEDQDFDEEVVTSWESEGLSMLLARLTSEGYDDRVAVIHWAADNNGFIGHATVRELCSYEPSKRLNGLTRPISRIADVLKTDGSIPMETAALLTADYDSSYSYVRASGFRLHPSAVPLLRDMTDERDGD